MLLDFVIRKANLGDLEAILALNEKLFALDLQFDQTVNLGFPRSQIGTSYFASRLSEEEGIAFVAEAKGQIVGYLVGALTSPAFYRSLKSIAELENMLVLKEHRSQGIGRALVQEFLRWAKDKKADRVQVVALAGNKPALAFYHELGFADYELSLELDLALSKGQLIKS